MGATTPLAHPDTTAQGAEDAIESEVATGSLRPDMTRDGSEVDVGASAIVAHPTTTAEGADYRCASDEGFGSLRLLTATWEDIQKTRLAAAQRGQDDLADILKKQEERYSRQIRRELEKQPVWPWLSQFPGLGGVHTARLIGFIGDAPRFPGQRCDKGHYSAPDYAVGTPCPVTTIDGACDGVMLPPRTTTGTRSIWHWAGLSPGARRKKGQRADFNPIVKTLCLMPGGIGEQIVRQRVPKYRGIYDTTKERLNRERAGAPSEVEGDSGPLPIHTAETADGREIDPCGGLRPIQIEGIARKVAVKAFVGDLLAEMKRLAAERPSEIEWSGGGETHTAGHAA